MLKIEEIFIKHLEAFKKSIIDKLAKPNGDIKPTILSAKTKAKISITTSPISAKMEVPLWFPAFETGRKPRSSTKNAGLYLLIWQWGKSRGIWKSNSVPKQIIEAKQMTWYINKYGTKLFRSGVFRDIFTGDIPKVMENIVKDLQASWVAEFNYQISSSIKAG